MRLRWLPLKAWNIIIVHAHRNERLYSGTDFLYKEVSLIQNTVEPSVLYKESLIQGFILSGTSIKRGSTVFVKTDGLKWNTYIGPLIKNL